MYYNIIYGRVWAIPTYRVYQLYDYININFVGEKGPRTRDIKV